MKLFRSAKLYISGVFILIAIASISGCMQCSTSISKRSFLNQTNKKLRLDGCDRNVVQLTVGKYELSDSTLRVKLKKMAAAGLITYKASRYAWWEKSQTNERKAVSVTRSLYGIWSYKDTEYRTVKADNYRFCDHYVVEIALTEKGKKLLCDYPDAIHNQDKEIQYDTELEDPDEYIWNQGNYSEAWPEIENPFIEKKTESHQSVESKATNQDRAVKSAEPENIIRIDSLQYQAFNKLDLSKYEIVYLHAYDVKARKMRYIQMYEESGAPKCRAELILVAKNVSDAGRIYYNVMEGEKYFKPITMDYYYDKGWILNSEPLEKFILENIPNNYHIFAGYEWEE